jgi:predicted dehydrogenase
MRRYRAAVVGCGRIGVTGELDPRRIKPATHVGAFRACDSTDLCAMVDIDPAQLVKAQAIAPGVPTYTSLEKMLVESRPDIVSICTPPEQHCLPTEVCARNSVPAIVCEKPIAYTLSDADRIIEACRAHRSLLFINHTRRFDRFLNDTCRDLKNGIIGEVTHGTAYYTAGIFNTGTHLVDLLRLLLGDVWRVSGSREDRFSYPAGDVNMNGWLVFNSGTVVAIQALEVKDYIVFEVRLYGREGCLTIDRFGFAVERTPVRECVDLSGYNELNVDQRTRQGGSRSLMKQMADHVAACLDGREKPISSGEDGLAALKILLSLKISAEADGKWVEPSSLDVDS